MYRDECPSQMVQNTWITRKSPKISNCDALSKIDGNKFYKNYLLKVKFNGNYRNNRIGVIDEIIGRFSEYTLPIHSRGRWAC